MDLDPKDNWDAWFDHNYLRWFDLNGHPALVKITKAETQELTMRGGIKKKAPVATIEQVQGKIDEPKPIVLNRTNARSIAAIHGTKPTDCLGKEVVLYPTTTEMYDKDLKKMVTVGCIRIREKKVK